MTKRVVVVVVSGIELREVYTGPCRSESVVCVCLCRVSSKLLKNAALLFLQQYVKNKSTKIMSTIKILAVVYSFYFFSFMLLSVLEINDVKIQFKVNG